MSVNRSFVNISQSTSIDPTRRSGLPVTKLPDLPTTPTPTAPTRPCDVARNVIGQRARPRQMLEAGQCLAVRQGARVDVQHPGGARRDDRRIVGAGARLPADLWALHDNGWILSVPGGVQKKLHSGPCKLAQRFAMRRDQIPCPRDLFGHPRRSRVLVIEQAHASLPVIGVEYVDRSNPQDGRECVDSKTGFFTRLSHRGLDDRLTALDAAARKIPAKRHPRIRGPA